MSFWMERHEQDRARIAELEAALVQSNDAFTVVNEHYLRALDAVEDAASERDEARRQRDRLAKAIEEHFDDKWGVLTEALDFIESWEDADK